MGFKDSIAFIKKLWILLSLSVLIAPNTSFAQVATLELHRIWAIDLDRNVTALRLADLDGDGTNEIFVGLWDGNSGYIEIFSGLNGILLQSSDKMSDHKILHLDVGDVDGDEKREIVVGADTTTPYYLSLVCILDGEELELQWEGIVDFVVSVEVEDIDNDDTAEAFIGTYYRVIRSDSDIDTYIRSFYHVGALYYLTWADKFLLNRIDGGSPYWKLIAHNMDQDSCTEIVYGTFDAYFQEIGGMGGYFTQCRRRAQVGVIHEDRSLSTISVLYDSKTEFYPYYSPVLKSIAIANCDSDDNEEIVSYMYCGENWQGRWNWAAECILSVSDATSGVLENSTSYTCRVVEVAVFDVNGAPPAEILIAYWNGIIQAIDGTTFDTVAISDPLPPISFFAFGDVTEDAMPEICISDGDSLFLYGFGPTGVEEEKEENLASKFILDQNFPNPFNPQTTIGYYLPRSSNVELCIYNIMGQKVKTLVNDFQPSGYQSVTWDGTDKDGAKVASGIYFYRVKTDYSKETRKMVLLK